MTYITSFWIKINVFYEEERVAQDQIQTMSFEEAGKALRAIIPLVGNPFMATTSDKQGKKYSHRKVLWDLRDAPREEIRTKLTAVGILNFKITGYGWLHIRIPRDAYVSSFRNSDNPKIWKEKNDKIIRRYMIMEVGRRLDRGR